MSVNLLPELRLEFLRLKGGCTGSTESTLFKMPHCWKSHVAAHLCMERGLNRHYKLVFSLKSILIFLEVF